MTDRLPEEHLANYRSLLSRVDQHCGKIHAEFVEQIACRAGCSGCCRHLALFPVEAANLVTAVEQLPSEVRSLLAGRIHWPENGTCPLLLDDRCTVYDNRPVICRTHGLPLLADVYGIQTVDCCPENFRGAAALPGSAVLHLESLNSALVAINALFVAQNDEQRFTGKERFTIADIILLAQYQELP